MAYLSAKNLATLLMHEVTLSNHGNYSVVDRALVVETHTHLLLQLAVRDLGTDGHSSLDGFLDLTRQFLELVRRLSALAAAHATLCRVQGRDLEEAMSLRHMTNSYDGLEVNLGNGL